MDTGREELFASLFSAEDRQSLGELNIITEKIIGCAFTVSNSLGCGFLEKVYENALAYELRKAGLSVSQQDELRVMYDGFEVGIYETDLLV